MTETAVVVGMGVVAPAGTTCDEYWHGLVAGRSFAEELPSDIPGVRFIGHRVPDGDWLATSSHSERRRLDHVALLGLCAARQALDAAAIPKEAIEPERFGMVVGIGFGGITTLTTQYEVLRRDGFRKASPFGITAVMPTSLFGYASVEFGVLGPAITLSSACASGTQAIVEGARLIADGAADVVLVGGAEAPLDQLVLAGFTRMEAMSRRFDAPTMASRPFDVDRDGFVIGEGAAFFVLTSQAFAATHGLSILAKVLGWSVTNDGFHITAPDPNAAGAIRCLRMALAMGGIDPAAVGHVNAHGTSTRLNDLAESVAICDVFGANAVPVTSAKGAVGHLMGGAGAVEAVEAVISMVSGTVPPTANCDNVDPEIELDVVQGAPRSIPVAPALTCSFAFGGQNASVLFGPAD